MGKEKRSGKIPSSALPVFEFEPFYSKHGQLWVPFHADDSGIPRLLVMTPEVMRQGVGQAMQWLGGNVISMAQRTLREHVGSEQKATGRH